VAEGAGLVVAGEIQPCVPDELQQIEKRWLGLIEGWAPLHCRDADCAGEMLEHHYGVPQSYSRPRLPAAFLAARKDRERWRGKLARLGEDVALVGAEPDD
jgi:hypothetical protein